MENRIFENYGGLTANDFDDASGDPRLLVAVPMYLFLKPDRIALTVQVWQSKEEFEARSATIQRFNRTFTYIGANLAEFRASYAQFIGPMEESALSWLGTSDETHDLESLSIDLDSLTISAMARHKTFTGWTVSRQTVSLAEFEQVKVDYPQLVQAYFGLQWTNAKAKDTRFARFN